MSNLSIAQNDDDKTVDFNEQPPFAQPAPRMPRNVPFALVGATIAALAAEGHVVFMPPARKRARLEGLGCDMSGCEVSK